MKRQRAPKAYEKLPEHLRAPARCQPCVLLCSKVTSSHSLSQQEQSPPVREPKAGSRKSETRRGGHGSCGVFYVAITALPSLPVLPLYVKSSSPGFELQRNGIIVHSGRGTTNIMFVRFSHVIVS